MDVYVQEYTLDSLVGTGGTAEAFAALPSVEDLGADAVCLGSFEYVGSIDRLADKVRHACLVRCLNPEEWEPVLRHPIDGQVWLRRILHE